MTIKNEKNQLGSRSTVQQHNSANQSGCAIQAFLIIMQLCTVVYSTFVLLARKKDQTHHCQVQTKLCIGEKYGD